MKYELSELLTTLGEKSECFNFHMYVVPEWWNTLLEQDKEEVRRWAKRNEVKVVVSGTATG